MNLFILSWSYLRAKRLLTILSLLLTAFGMATITILMLVSHHLENQFLSDAKGIDLVVGAKGSPIQLILCNVFQMDVPTGNIPLQEAEVIMKNRLVKKAIPIALGDNYQAYRIVGTTPDYPAHYQGKVARGRLWQKPLEVTIGSAVAHATGLKPGDTFSGSHGLAASSDVHKEAAYLVVGLLEPSHSVMDRLILTSVESVWAVHDHAEEEEAGEEHTEDHAHEAAEDHEDESKPKEITALLLQYRSPMGAVVMPRLVNSQGALQAASPAFELAKLFSLVGMGVDAVGAFAYLFVLMAGLSVFVILYNTLRERAYDLAVMRMLGASPAWLFLLLMTEGLILVLAGTLLGIILGHAALLALQPLLDEAGQMQSPGLFFIGKEWRLVGLAVLMGLVAALIPAWGAYRLDIAKVLAKG